MNGCEIMKCKHYDERLKLCDCRDDTCIYNNTETHPDIDELKAKARLFDELVKAADEFTKEKLSNDGLRSGRAWYDRVEEDLFTKLTDSITKTKELSK